MLTLRRMAPDASRVLDTEGKTIIDGNAIPGYRTLEGPKLYKANGYYYVFAPAGGVEQGWQAVFRARAIDGPYEVRTVMDQGSTPVNGPHQGAWVRAQDGSDWFMHFQDKGAYGRVVHLQPMHWADDWPVIGADGPKHGSGQPVSAYRKPVQGSALKVPATSDEFDDPALGLQWQWNANSDPRWHSLSEHQGTLRLHTQSVPAADSYVRAAPNIVTQKLPAPVFTVRTHMQLNDATDGDRAGLILNAMQYAWIGLRRADGATQLVYTTCIGAKAKCTEQPTVLLAHAPESLYLRMDMAEGAVARFSYSTDNQHFMPAGEPFAVGKGRWVGAQVGLFAVGAQPTRSSLDVDYFRVTPR